MLVWYWICLLWTGSTPHFLSHSTIHHRLSLSFHYIQHQKVLSWRAFFFPSKKNIVLAIRCGKRCFIWVCDRSYLRRYSLAITYFYCCIQHLCRAADTSSINMAALIIGVLGRWGQFSSHPGLQIHVVIVGDAFRRVDHSVCADGVYFDLPQNLLNRTDSRSLCVHSWIGDADLGRRIFTSHLPLLLLLDWRRVGNCRRDTVLFLKHPSRTPCWSFSNAHAAFNVRIRIDYLFDSSVGVGTIVDSNPLDTRSCLFCHSIHSIVGVFLRMCACSASKWRRLSLERIVIDEWFLRSDAGVVYFRHRCEPPSHSFIRNYPWWWHGISFDESLILVSNSLI